LTVVRGRHALILFLLLVPLFATPSQASQSVEIRPAQIIEIRPAQINLSPEDTLRIAYAGKKQIRTVLPKTPTGLELVATEQSNSSSNQGALYLSPENATENLYQYSPAFYSSAPYTVAVTALRYNMTTYFAKEMGNPPIEVRVLWSTPESIAEYTCPENITVQVNLSIQTLGSSSQKSTSLQSSVFATLSSVPQWEIGLYAIILTPFLGIAILNVRDLQRARKIIWTTRHSAVMVLRHLFFGLVFSFVVVCTVFSALLIGGVILGAPPSLGWTPIWTLLIPALPIIPLGVVYALAKRSGWYDLLDEAG